MKTSECVLFWRRGLKLLFVKNQLSNCELKTMLTESKRQNSKNVEVKSLYVYVYIYDKDMRQKSEKSNHPNRFNANTQKHFHI